MPTNEENHWAKLSTQWSFVEPPLRPTAASISAMREILNGHDDHILVLGVTRELVAAFGKVTAVEKNAAVIRQHWPEVSGAGKTCLHEDWLNLDSGGEQVFTAVIGDGSLNNVSYPDQLLRLQEVLQQITVPSAKFACRVYLRPDLPVGDEEIIGSAEQGKINFSALKMLLAMAIAGRSQPNVPVMSILHEFNRLFPDRPALSRKSGWPLAAIETIDSYQDSPLVYAFPNRAELLACLSPFWPDIEFVMTDGYPLADCCPLVILSKTWSKADGSFGIVAR